MKLSWLWSPVYKGLEISSGQKSIFLGITHKEWKERGW